MDRALMATLHAAVADPLVLEAIAAIPRERFVAEADQERAYENVALPIACDQTISQPLVVARMLELLELEPTDRVLDIGTGSGYHAALLAQLCDHVWSIERHPDLSRRARRTLADLGIGNVSCVTGDGSRGLAAEAPFDAINVAAATSADALAPLESQLRPGGRLVVPVGGKRQHLVRVHRERDGIRREAFEAVRFVPLVRGPVR